MSELVNVSNINYSKFLKMESPRRAEECDICKCKFDTKSLLQTSNNVFFCKDCFKQRLCSVGKTYEAGDAKRKLSTEYARNHSHKMFPCPEIYLKSPEVDTRLELPGRSITSTTSLSKRPIQCPKADCNKFISILALENHFRHEHKEVPTVSTHLDARCATEFYPRDVRYGIIQCNVLLKIINHEDLNRHKTSKFSVSLESQVPVMVLLATRIPAFCLMQKYNPVDEESENSYSSAQTVLDQENPELFRPGDKIIVWLASNIATNMNYTVAVSTMDNEIRQKYFGPLLTLNPYPEQVCRDGSCLILTDIHCARMTENGTKPLALDVVMHGPD